MTEVRLKSIEKVILTFFAFGTFCNAYFCVMWPTYPYKFLTTICHSIPIVSIVLLLLFLGWKSKSSFKIKKKAIPVFITIVIAEFHLHFMGKIVKSSITLGDIVLLFCVFTLLIMPDYYKKYIYECLYKLFAIMLLPSCIYYLLGIIGINFPHTILETSHSLKSLYGYYYLHYPFGLVIHDPGTINRLCGLFDEAGFVGSLCAIFLSASWGSNISKKWKYLMLVEGILSLSLAFYLLMIIFAEIRAFQKGATKVAIFIVVTLLALFVFTNVEFTSPELSRLQSRINVGHTFIFNNNRTTKAFESEFSAFLTNFDYATFFGNGWDAYTLNPSMSGSFSYKCLVYDFGLIGLFLYTLPFILLVVYYKPNKIGIAFATVFFVSIYQRPYVLTIQYITIFMTAMCSCKYYEGYKMLNTKKLIRDKLEKSNL